MVAHAAVPILHDAGALMTSQIPAALLETIRSANACLTDIGALAGQLGSRERAKLWETFKQTGALLNRLKINADRLFGRANLPADHTAGESLQMRCYTSAWPISTVNWPMH